MKAYVGRRSCGVEEGVCERKECVRKVGGKGPCFMGNVTREEVCRQREHEGKGYVRGSVTGSI